MGIISSTLRTLFKSIQSIITLLHTSLTSFNQVLHRASQSPGLPNPNPTKPYWLLDPPFPELTNVKSSQLPETAHVAIIGSGITGAAIARSLLHERKRRRKGAADTTEKIVVLEARELCSGATGRNGGHIKPAPYEVFSRFSKSMAKERAAALTRFQVQHVECLMELCETEEISVAEARAVETVDLFLDDESFEKGVREVGEMREWLPEVGVNVWDSAQAQEKFGVNDSVVGALSYTAGAIFAYRFVVSIWKRLQDEFRNQLLIETNTPVESISISSSDKNKPPTGYPYAIKTPRGTIHVRHIAHATNSSAGHLVPGLRSKITGVRAHMSAQTPGDDFPHSNGKRSWSVIYGGAFDYVTQRPSTTNEPGDVMLGGGFVRSLKQGLDQIGIYDDGARLDALTVAHIAGIFPAIFNPRWGDGSKVKQVWSGIIGVTGDLIPLVGRLSEDLTGRKVQSRESLKGKQEELEYGEWIAAGFSGEGMVWAWKCGVALGIMIAGSQEEDLEAVPGRPGGRLMEWFPKELVVCPERIRSADVSNLADML